MHTLRVEQGLTQEKIADDLGCTIAFISNVENNRAKLNLRVLLYYAKICNVSVDSILNAGMEDGEATPEDVTLNEQMLRIFNHFDVDTRKKIIKTLKIWKDK